MDFFRVQRGRMNVCLSACLTRWLHSKRIKGHNDSIYNLFVCLSIRVCLYMLASSVYTIDLTDDIVDTSEERLLFFDVQKERTHLLNVCIFITAALKKQLNCQSFLLRISDE